MSKHDYKEMHSWFLSLFKKRMDRDGNIKCFECGETMSANSYSANPMCYSHILPKAKYRDYAMKEWNVVIVHPDCHNLYEMRPSKAINQHNLKKELLLKLSNEEL